MLSPLSNELYQSTAILAQENPACELFPATHGTGRLFGFGVGLGLISLFLDGLGATPFGWAMLGISGLVLLFAGSQVVHR